MRVSVSQVKQWRMCKRKYAFRWSRFIKTPDSEAKLFGSKVHEHLENYLLNGTMPPETPEGRVARLGIISGMLPQPGTCDVEIEFSVELWPDVFFVGLIDVLERDRVMVTDHKTTSSIARYTMSKEDILSDEQALGYALVAMEALGSSHAYVRWLYYEKKKTRGEIKPGGFKEVYNKIKWPECEDLAYALIKDIWECVKLRKERPDPNTLEASLEACHMYGGCEYRMECGRTSTQIIRAAFVAERK